MEGYLHMYWKYKGTVYITDYMVLKQRELIKGVVLICRDHCRLS